MKLTCICGQVIDILRFPIEGGFRRFHCVCFRLFILVIEEP
jgi:hypothetical protein